MQAKAAEEAAPAQVAVVIVAVVMIPIVVALCLHYHRQVQSVDSQRLD